MTKPSFESSDVQQNRFIGGIGYLLPLFLLPLLLCPKSKYARYCANQGLLLTIVSLAVSVVAWLLGGIPLIGWIVYVARWLIHAVLGLIAIYYAYLACSSGDARELPVIGNIRIIK